MVTKIAEIPKIPCTGFPLSHLITHRWFIEGLHPRTPQGAGYGIMPSSAKPDGFIIQIVEEEYKCSVPEVSKIP